MADLCDIFQTRGETDEIGIETDRTIIATDRSNDECLEDCGIEVTLSSVEHGVVSAACPQIFEFLEGP